jgi:hypothetical protein
MMKIQVIKKADKKPSDAGCSFIIEQLPEPRK